MLTKTEILRKYRDELVKLLNVINYSKDKWKSVIDFIEYREEQEFILAKCYLNQYPCLNDKDCSGRGLPKHTVKKYLISEKG